jgi:uncharacterized membrane protein YfcA
MTDQIILNLAIFVASFLQGAIGIGFGVIAGPVVLIVMNDGAAIQVSILLSFLSAAMLAPGVRRQVDRPLLKRIFAGSLLGAPLGIVLFGLIGVATLKLLAAISVAFMAAVASGLITRLRAMTASRTNRPASNPGSSPVMAGVLAGAVGIISGMMNAALAMPGPVVAAFMAAADRGKQATRAMTLMLFVISYPVAYAFQWAVAGRSDAALLLSLWLAPTTIAGVVAGRLTAPLISERLFRKIIIALLIATAGALLLSL